MKQSIFHISRIVSVILAGIAVTASCWIVYVPAAHAEVATLYLSPSSKTVTVGDSFTETLYVGTDVAMNSAQATITFPNNLLKVTSVSSSGIFTMWPEAAKYSNTAGTVTFVGGLASPGYKGTSGKILTITFKALSDGAATVSVTNGQVIENNAAGTSILGSQRTAGVTITKPTPVNTNVNTNRPVNTNTNTNSNTNSGPPAITTPVLSSPSNPSQDAWSRSNDITVSWQGGNGIEGYNLVWDSTPDTIPTEDVTYGATSYTKTGVPDGVWYLHLRAKYATGWSSTATYRFQVDVTPPAPFSIAIEGDPTVSFQSSDATSGVDHYELSLDGQAFATVTSPYTTPILDPGTHTIIVRAFDKAGNMTQSSTQFDVTGTPEPILVDLTPVLNGNKPLIMHGFSNAQDSLRLTIDGTNYGPYPVKDYIDPNPPTKAPDGKVAWKIEVTPNVGAGEHEITLTAIGADGRESAVTPPVKFKIVTNAVQIGSALVPTALIVNILVIIVVLLLGVSLFFAIKYFRLRRLFKKTSVRPDILAPASGDVHIHLPDGSGSPQNRGPNDPV